jgi:hypothetical protein
MNARHPTQTIENAFRTQSFYPRAHISRTPMFTSPAAERRQKIAWHVSAKKKPAAIVLDKVFERYHPEKRAVAT